MGGASKSREAKRWLEHAEAMAMDRAMLRWTNDGSKSALAPRARLKAARRGATVEGSNMPCLWRRRAVAAA